MKRLRRGQRGVALITALAFMALAVPIVTAALGLSGTLSQDSRIKTDILKRQYGSLGGQEHALYRLLYEAGYASGLVLENPDTYTVTLNNQPVAVTVVRTANPRAELPVIAQSSRRLHVNIAVTPISALPSVPTLFTYTITVENLDVTTVTLNQIFDTIPSGFAYVAGSTGGVTARNPTITGQTLAWDLGNLGINLPPGVKTTLRFDATASPPTGTYCSVSWVKPGDEQTSSGMTAPVTIGSPPNTLCNGAAANVIISVDPAVVTSNTPTTYTYTVSVVNIGTVTLDIERVRDLLPSGFTYLPGTTSGTFTTANPQAIMFQGRQRLTWDFTPDKVLPGGATGTLIFQATATLASGTYRNEAWITAEELPTTIYTWPTAPVFSMSIFKITAVQSGVTTRSEVWIGDETYTIPLRNTQR